MGNSFLIGILVFGVIFGGLAGSKLSSLNPFKSNPTVQKSEGSKEEYFNDKIKGIEYKAKESYKNQAPTNAGNSIGQRVGRFIDSSIQLIIYFTIGGLILLFFTGINIFRWVRTLLSHRKALIQVIKGVQNAKPKLNGSADLLSTSLATEMDSDSKKIISDIKHTEGLK